MGGVFASVGRMLGHLECVRWGSKEGDGWTYLDEIVLVAGRGCCLRFRGGLILKGESILRFPPSEETAAVEGLGRMSMIEVVERMILRSCCR